MQSQPLVSIHVSDLRSEFLTCSLLPRSLFGTNFGKASTNAKLLPHPSSLRSTLWKHGKRPCLVQNLLSLFSHFPQKDLGVSDCFMLEVVFSVCISLVFSLLSTLVLSAPLSSSLHCRGTFNSPFPCRFGVPLWFGGLGGTEAFIKSLFPF
jgi:hypothetical protein